MLPTPFCTLPLDGKGFPAEDAWPSPSAMPFRAFYCCLLAERLRQELPMMPCAESQEQLSRSSPLWLVLASGSSGKARSRGYLYTVLWYTTHQTLPHSKVLLQFFNTSLKFYLSVEHSSPPQTFMSSISFCLLNCSLLAHILHCVTQPNKLLSGEISYI